MILTSCIIFFKMYPHLKNDKIMGKKIIPQKKWTKDPASSKVISYLKKIVLMADIESVIRRSFDEIYKISGKHKYGELTNTDKCYFGTIVEKHILKELGLAKSEDQYGPDTMIEGVPIDVKTSASKGDKMPRTHKIPIKHVGEHILLVCCNDHVNKYQIGILKADRKMLRKISRKRNRGGPGQDGKRGINALGYASTEWLKEGSFPKSNSVFICDGTNASIFDAEETFRVSKVRVYDVAKTVRSGASK